MDYKISIDPTYTLKMFQGFFTKKFRDDFGTTTSCFMNCNKIYIYWGSIRGCLYESRDGTINEIEDYSHFFMNLLLCLYEAGTFFIPSR